MMIYIQSSLEQSFLKGYTGKSAEVIMTVFESYNLQGLPTLSYNIATYVHTYQCKNMKHC